MKNILVIQGGGRPKGNTSQLIDSFVKGAADAGSTVEVVSLMKNEVKGWPGLQRLPLRKALHAKGRLQRSGAKNQII